jgi:MAC/Perforin domain/Hemopexin
MPSEPRTIAEVSSLPGLDVVGHGIYLRPHLPYELRGVLFPRSGDRSISMRDATTAYAIPEGYDIDDSPPMPAGQLLNQVKIEESWDRFSKQLSLDASVAGGNGAFSVSATNASQMRVDEDAYYAIRTSFIPLWSVYLSDLQNHLPGLDEAEIPVPFKFRHRRAYERFFDQYGSHFVKRAWIGGKASLLFTVLKSSQLSKQEIQAGIKASTVGASAQANAALSESRERLLTNSQCSVAGKGGDELKLASLSSLDEAVYNQWVASVRDNPQTIELEVAGIWTLLTDPERAQTLSEAYRALNAFTGLNAAFTVDKTVYFVRGRKYFSYHMELGESEKPRLLVDRWLDLAAAGLDRVDAAFSGEHLQFASQVDLRRQVHVFYRDVYARIDMDTDRLTFGPVPLGEAWPGLEFPRIDTAFALGRDTVYFFCGKDYVRFNTREHRVDPGYPQPFGKRWKGVSFDRLDAALYWGNGKVYFFRDDHYIRYDTVTFRSDPGYPKTILGDYVEDWKFFD